MPVLSHVLVVEHTKEDAEIERALTRPGFDVRYASGMDEALELTVALLPVVIILDAIIPGLDTWRWIAEIWEEARKHSHSPAFILLADQTEKWHVGHFGPVRFSDRRHLQEAFRDILAGPKREHGPDLADEGTWRAVVDRVKAGGNQRFQAEEERLRRGGILDERGKLISDKWPADMKTGSKTDVAT